LPCWDRWLTRDVTLPLCNFMKTGNTKKGVEQSVWIWHELYQVSRALTKSLIEWCWRGQASNYLTCECSFKVRTHYRLLASELQSLNFLSESKCTISVMAIWSPVHNNISKCKIIYTGKFLHLDWVSFGVILNLVIWILKMTLSFFTLILKQSQNSSNLSSFWILWIQLDFKNESKFTILVMAIWSPFQNLTAK